MPQIEVRSSDPELAAAVRHWLAEGRIDPPLALTIEIAVGEVPPLVSDPRPVFQQPNIQIRSGGRPDAPLTVDWEPAPARAELSPNGTTARIVLSPAARDRLEECERAFFFMALIFLLRRAGWHHVHAATALDHDGRGWLLAGNSKAGKSTTTALLARAGWGVGTDDVAFLTRSNSGVEVEAFRSRIALREAGRVLLGQGGGLYLAKREKTAFWPEELGTRWVPRIRPEVLLFPSVGDQHTTVAPLGPKETLAELVRWSAWVMLEPHLAQEHLELLAELGSQARSYRVTLGRDLFGDPNVLTRLIA